MWFVGGGVGRNQRDGTGQVMTQRFQEEKLPVGVYGELVSDASAQSSLWQQVGKEGRSLDRRGAMAGICHEFSAQGFITGNGPCQ